MSEKCDYLSNSEWREVRHSSIDTVDRVENAYIKGNDAQGALNQWHKELNDYERTHKCPESRESKRTSDNELLSKNDTGILPALEITEIKNLVTKYGHNNNSGNGKSLKIAEISELGRNSNSQLTDLLVFDGIKRVTQKNGEVSEASLAQDLKKAKDKANGGTLTIK